MFENITVIILAIIAVGAGVWCWWFTNHDSEPDTSDEKEQQN